MKKLIPIYAILSLVMAYFMEVYLHSRWDIWNLPTPVVKIAMGVYLFMLIYAIILFSLIDYVQNINKKIKDKQNG